MPITASTRRSDLVATATDHGEADARRPRVGAVAAIDLSSSGVAEAQLHMWTIFEHPLDYPEHFVVRRFTVTRRGPVPDPYCTVVNNLIEARLCVPPDCTLFARDPRDHPSIVETWME